MRRQNHHKRNKCSAADFKELFTEPIQAWVYEMRDHSLLCAERYLDLDEKDEQGFHKRYNPCIGDHQFGPDDVVTQGTLEPVASRIVPKMLYTSRTGRSDTLCSLSTLCPGKSQSATASVVNASTVLLNA